MASTMKVSFSTNSNVRVKALDKAKFSILLLLGAWAFSFKEQLSTIYYSYNESNYETHIFIALIGFIILYLSKYKELTRTTIKSNQLGLLSTLLTTIFWALANIAGSSLIENILLLALLPMMFFTAFGWQAFKKTLYAWAFIFCTLPIGKLIGTVYKNSFFNILVKILSFTSDEVYWQNNLIEFAEHTFDLSKIMQVLDNMMLFLTVTFFIMYYITSVTRKRIFLNILAIFMPGALLILTQFMIIRFSLVNSYTQESTCTYIILSASLALILLLGLIGKSQRKKSFNMYSESQSWSSNANTRIRWIKPTIVSICILLTLPFATNSLKSHVLNYQGEVLLALPDKTGNWLALNTDTNKNENMLIKKYQQYNTQPLELRAKFFENALINHPEDMANFLNINWQLIKEHTVSKQVLDQEIQLEERIYSDGNQYKLVWSFYAIHQHIFAKHSYAIVADNWYTLTQSSRRSSLITLAINCNSNIEGSRNQLYEFLTNFWPELPQISNPPRKLS